MIHDVDVPAETVEAFAEHMASEFGATLVSPLPAWLQAWFSVVGGLQPTGVAVGRTVYTPHPFGPTLTGWAGWSQIRTLTHECQHVDQAQRQSLVGFSFGYATSTARRTEAESECFVAEMELELWRRGEIAPWWFAARASALAAYHVSRIDIAVCERHARALAPTIRRAGYVTRAGRTAIRWLDEHAPELRHPSVRSRADS